MDDPEPELNRQLDRAQLAERFRRRGRIHIADVLTEASARRLFYALERETPWKVTFNEGQEVLEFDAVSPVERQKITHAAWNRARSRFQYLYRQHHLSHRGEPYPNPDHYLGKLV